MLGCRLAALDVAAEPIAIRPRLVHVRNDRQFRRFRFDASRIACDDADTSCGRSLFCGSPTLEEPWASPSANWI
jgi:hypothetical protein